MRIFKKQSMCLAALLLTLLGQAVHAEPKLEETPDRGLRIVGWWVWRPNNPLTSDQIPWDQITHLSLNPSMDVLVSADGSIKNTGKADQAMVNLVKAAHKHGVKVQIMLGERPENFTAMMAAPQTRERFIRNVIALIEEFGIDGIEYDWEGLPGQTPPAEQIRNFSDLMIETRKAFGDREWLLSFDGAAWEPFFITTDAIKSVDFVNIMSYHGMDQAKQTLKMWADFGMPRDRINLGVGFFGDHKNPETVAAKTNYVVKEEFGGLFLFYLNLDEDGTLMNALAAELNKPSLEPMPERGKRIVAWYVWRPSLPLPHDEVPWDEITHLVLNLEHELLMNADGTIKATGRADKDIASLVRKAHENDVKIQVMFGEPQDAFSEMMSNPKTRAAWIENIHGYVKKHEFDGVEYDWEGRPGQTHEQWLGAKGEKDREAFTQLLIETKNRFAEDKLLLTIDGAAWKPYFFTEEAIPYLDFINIMSYHGMAQAKECLKLWDDFGMPRDRINLGIGFFGDHNNVETVVSKTEYIIEHGYGGLFLFYLNLNPKGDYARAIDKTIRSRKQQD